MIKQFVFSLLCNNWTGGFIYFIFNGKVPNLRYWQFKFDLTEANIEKRMVASVFFGFYESAEIRLVEKYVDGGLDVIELGASCGIVSSHLASKFTSSSRQLISIEANELLARCWMVNTSRHNFSKASILFLSRAIYYRAESVDFAISKNTTESKIGNPEPSNHIISVKSVSLAKLIEDYSIDKFILVCDIEGAEVELFLLEKLNYLQKCRKIVIELHNTSDQQTMYTVESIDELIQSKGFTLCERQGNVFYYESIL
jgi:FkbM family methyltransferase